MEQHAHSEATIVLIRDHLHDLGSKLAWVTCTPNDVEQAHVIIRSIIEDDMFAMVMLDAKTSALTRINVYNRAKAPLIKLSFEQTVHPSLDDASRYMDC